MAPSRLTRWLGAGKQSSSHADPFKQATELYRAGRFDEAAEAARRLLQKSPGHADTLHLLAQVALRRAQFAAAARHMEDALNAAERGATVRIDLLHDLGEALALAGRKAGATEAYEKTIAAGSTAAAPPSARDQALVANALLRLERADEAEKQARAALEIDANDADALAVSARLAARAGDGAAAKARLRRAVEQQPGDVALMSELAHLLVGQDRQDEAEALLRAVLTVAPTERMAQFALVDLLAARVRNGKDHATASLPPASAGSGTIPVPATAPFISVIICSVNAAKFATVTANYATLLAGHPYEIIGIHDAKSLCEGYNRGAAQSRGDILVFSHDDIEILTPDFGARLVRHMARHDIAGACGTSLLVAGHWISAGWPYLHGLVAHQYPAGHAEAGRYRVMVLDASFEDATGGLQALDGLFIAVNRRVLERCRFDEQTFDGFHLYDLDFTFSAFLAGFDVAVFRDITLVHRTTGDSPDYESAFTRYRLRFEEKYAADLAPRDAAPLQFVPALFDGTAEVRRFCQELLAFRREAAAGRAAQRMNKIL